MQLVPRQAYRLVSHPSKNSASHHLSPTITTAERSLIGPGIRSAAAGLFSNPAAWVIERGCWGGRGIFGNRETEFYALLRQRLQSKFIIGSYRNLSKKQGSYYPGGMQLVPSQAYQSVSHPSENSASHHLSSSITTAERSLIRPGIRSTAAVERGVLRALQWYLLHSCCTFSGDFARQTC